MSNVFPVIGEVLKGGGPWATLLALVVGFLWALVSGRLVTGAEMTRTVAHWTRTVESLERAAVIKDATIEKQAEQLDKLMAHSAVSSHALDSILEEAKNRGYLAKEEPRRRSNR